MDRTKNGTSGRALAWAAAILAAAALAFGGVSQITTIGDKLDRNCRILGAIQADVRFLIVRRTTPESAKAFRRLFQHAAVEGCG